MCQQGDHLQSLQSHHMKTLLLLIILISLSHCEIVPLHKHIVQQIFQQNKPYLIYVHGLTHNFEVESVFNGYCFGDKLCAVLDPNIQDYADILQYVGTNEDEYFLILDSTNKRKYVLTIKDSSITQNDLLSFEYKVLNKQIDPYFASQELPAEVNDKCTRLVGRNVGEFLRRVERIKVILLYSLSRYCPTCEEVLSAYTAFAQQNYSQKEVAFGYFNTFLNDHPVIHDEKTPNLLIFIDKNYQSPFELTADSLQYLKIFIQKTLNKKAQKAEIEIKQQL